MATVHSCVSNSGDSYSDTVLTTSVIASMEDAIAEKERSIDYCYSNRFTDKPNGNLFTKGHKGSLHRPIRLVVAADD